jgi:protein gp37
MVLTEKTMGDNTGIEWTDATWNPTTGCTKVSAGCKHCYAERDWARLVHLPSYKGRAFTDVACHEERLSQPLRWQKPRMIFVNSMSDLFHPDVPDEFVSHVFKVMRDSPQHTFQVLTKRAERMRDFLSVRYPVPLPNVWLGISVEDQSAADERIPLLLDTPAAVRWISAEPLLGSVDLWPMLIPHMNHGEDRDPLDWVVVGGESGPKARPMHPNWARSLRDQCAAAGVPFLFKQWGEWKPVTEKSEIQCYPTFVKRDPGDIRQTQSGCHHMPHQVWACATEDHYGWRFPVVKVGKKAAGRLLDGVQHDGYPGGAA